MKRKSVQSSTLLSIGYDERKHILELQFTSSDVYQYAHVPAHVYDGLLVASSKGSYFNEHIKDQYEFEKMD